MTSRSCTKSYSRKVNTVTPGSIQFDKLFRENSNRPSAAKSAGTVGKWGITSFTSIRSTSINGRRDDIVKTFGPKRPKLDYGNQNARVTAVKDPFSFEADPESKPEAASTAATTASAVPKPKKFFKSRNAPVAATAPTVEPLPSSKDASIYTKVPDSQYVRSRAQRQPHQTTTPKQQPQTPTQLVQSQPQLHSQPQPTIPKLASYAAPAKRSLSESFDSSSSETSNRDDGKPPIVLRICKGTARLVCADNQESPDSEPETYRITTTPQSSPTKIELDRKRSFSPEVNLKQDLKLSGSRGSQLQLQQQQQQQQQQPMVTTVSIPLDNSDMRRTTRSRAKNLQIDLTPRSSIVASSSSPPPPPSASSSAPPTTPNSHSSGLSLTLRKSVTDSNNTLISHYDIVKTDCSTSYTSKQPTIEPLIGRDQPLPTTTQELIDILSSDADSMMIRSEAAAAAAAAAASDLEAPISRILEETSECQVDDAVQHCSIDLPPAEPEPRIDVHREPEVETPAEVEAPISMDVDSESTTATTATTTATTSAPPLPPPPPPPAFEAETAAAKTLVDQDWYSGSEDSEETGGNAENELPTNAASPASEMLQPMMMLKSSSAMNLAAKPATKKGSIFKSRSTGATNSNKRRALYKHKWCDSDKESCLPESTSAGDATPNAASGSHGNAGNVAFEEEFEAEELTRVVTYPETDMDFTDETEAITSIRCGKKVKGFYTVVKNVKKAHQIQESGEFQEFNDDVEYILDTLRENNPNATRCLSAIRLASKCMAPAFRMHVRAHGTVAKFFKALHDATKDQSLGLCTATVMFVLSQDRLAMDLDRDCLELMLSLLESDASHKDALDDCGLSRAELLKNKEKVRQLCADIQAQGHAKHLNLDNITVGQLAMETLLSLTSRRAGEWFKEELRELGGLEHIVKTIRDCHRHINASEVTRSGWSEPLLDKLRKVDRCLRVLENVTHMNEENQVYLLKYGDGVLVSTLASLYDLCGQEIPIYPTFDPGDKSSTGAVVRECLFAIIKVLINLTHRFNRQSFGSKSVGAQTGVVDCSLNLLLRLPDSLPDEKRFDLMMLALILLINLVEQCEDNKKLLIDSKSPPYPENLFDTDESGVEALIELFYKQEELARLEEQKTDAILDGKKDSEQTETVSTTTKTQEEFIEETVTKLLQKAGRHMEHTLIGAYVVLLLGYLVMDNKEYETVVRSKLPENKFATMVTVLQKFFNFMNLTASNEASSCGIAATDKVIKFLKLSDARAEEEKNELPLPALEDSSIMLDMSSSL